MVDKIEAEFSGFSRWFRVSFFVLLFIYIGFWLYTIELSNIQKQNFLQPILPTIPQDSEEYTELSESIIKDNRFYSDGEVNTLRAPGYPFFMAVLKSIFGTYFFVTLSQIILIFCSAVVIRRLGAFFHSYKAGEIAGVLFLINPLVLTLSLVLLTDTLFLFLFLLGFYIAIKKNGNKYVVYSSLIFALSIYVRPMGVFALPIFMAPFLVSKDSYKEKIKAFFITAFVILICALPWVYRNYKITDVVGFTSFKAINLADYAAPLFLSNLNKTSLEKERSNLEYEIGITRDKWSDLRYSKKVSDVALKIILSHPFEYTKYHIITSLSFIFSSSIQDTLITYQSSMHTISKYPTGAINHLAAKEWALFFDSITSVWWKVVEKLCWFFVYVVALLVVWKERKRLIVWVFIFVPIYFMILAGPAANARYAVQGLPFVLILFSVGLMNLRYKIKNKNV